ncbi:MAG: hypothetical protein KAX28_01340 [Candidatus Marinimicrobia bacterium]|nr:hypothetical protein [Candidatus Neomarinimicrobiota bacterium]
MTSDVSKFRNFSIHVGKYSVNIITSLDIFKAYQNMIESGFVPIFNCLQERSRSNYFVYHLESDENKICFSSDYHTITALFPSKILQNGKTLLYIAYPLIEYQLQNEGLLTAHSACVEIDNKGVLLLGKIGSGKTSTAITLCKDYNGKLIGSDVCIIGLRDNKPVAIHGTHYFFLRKKSVEKTLPWLLEKFTYRSEKDPWLDKIKIYPSELGFETCQYPVEINKVYFLHIDNEQNELHVTPADNLVNRLYLNENFSRYIRMTVSTILCGDKNDFCGYYPSLDSEVFYYNRINFINKLVYSIGIQYISGPLSSAANYIYNDLQRRKST